MKVVPSLMLWYARKTILRNRHEVNSVMSVWLFLWPLFEKTFGCWQEMREIVVDIRLLALRKVTLYGKGRSLKTIGWGSHGPFLRLPFTCCRCWLGHDDTSLWAYIVLSWLVWPNLLCPITGLLTSASAERMTFGPIASSPPQGILQKPVPWGDLNVPESLCLCNRRTA